MSLGIVIFVVFALVSWKSSMFKDYCAVAWAWESDSFCISCCFTWSNLNKQRISCCYLDDDSFFKHTDAKLFCNHLATFYIFFIIHHSSHSCAKKQVLQTKASQQLSGGTQSEAATSCSTQISSPNRPTSCSCLSDCYATKGTFSTLKLFEMLFVCALSIWTWTWLAKNWLSGMFKYPLSPYKS